MDGESAESSVISVYYRVELRQRSNVSVAPYVTPVTGFGPRVSVARSRDVLIIESPRRAAARRRLAEQIRRLRLTARRLGSPTRREIAAEVSAARARRASQRIGARSI